MSEKNKIANPRELGDRIKYFAEVNGFSSCTLGKTLNCSELQIERLYKGLAFASFKQILKLSQMFNVTVEDLIYTEKTKSQYTYVQDTNEFTNNDNKEKILDLIYSYIDIVDSLHL